MDGLRTGAVGVRRDVRRGVSVQARSEQRPERRKKGGERGSLYLSAARHVRAFRERVAVYTRTVQVCKVN